MCVCVYIFLFHSIIPCNFSIGKHVPLILVLITFCSKHSLDPLSPLQELAPGNPQTCLGKGKMLHSGRTTANVPWKTTEKDHSKQQRKDKTSYVIDIINLYVWLCNYGPYSPFLFLHFLFLSLGHKFTLCSLFSIACPFFFSLPPLFSLFSHLFHPFSLKAFPSSSLPLPLFLILSPSPHPLSFPSSSSSLLPSSSPLSPSLILSFPHPPSMPLFPHPPITLFLLYFN